MEYFTVLELYSGPGGLSTGFLKSKFKDFRFKIIVANDIDKNASDTYKENHENVDFVLGSIVSEVTKKQILNSIKKSTGKTTVDVVIGGPPCQGFSVTNKMTRTPSNPLNQLVLHFVDMVKRTRPFAFVMENVPGMLSMQNGAVLKRLVKEFHELGYHNVDCWTLNAAEYGVPQFRKRAFVVGSKSDKSIEKPMKTHGPTESEKNNLQPYVTLADAICDLPSIAVGKQTSNSDRYRFSRSCNDFQKEMKKRVKKIKNHVVTINSDIVVRRFMAIPQGGNLLDVPKELLQLNGQYKSLKNTHGMIYRRLSETMPSITITNFRKAMLIHPTQNRLLSVREAARIQTFPDDFKFKGPLSMMQQQVSDAVPVTLAMVVGNSMLEHIAMSMLYAQVKN